MKPARYMCVSSGHRCGVSEQRLPRLDVDRAPVLEPEPGRIVHPCVDRDDEQRAGQARHHDGHAAQEVQPRRHAIPAVDVDRDEDRLDEEREALQAEGKAEDVPERGHEVRPQQAHLERQDRPGHDADREEGDHDLRPALGERPVELVAGAQVERLDEQDHARERDPEAHERDVHGERQRLHLPRFEQVLLLDRRKRRRQQLRWQVGRHLGRLSLSVKRDVCA